MKIKVVLFKWFIFALTIGLTLSCKKTETHPEGIIVDKELIMINVKAEIDHDNNVAKKATISKDNSKLNSSVLDTIIDLGDGYQIHSTFEPILTSTLSPYATIKKSKNASTEPNKAQAIIPISDYFYKVFMFEKDSGKLVAERTYVRGTEANTSGMPLRRGTKYTVVAFSLYDNTDDLESYVHYTGSDRQNGQISDFSIRMPSGDEAATKDLLYMTNEIVTPADADSFNLTILLKHMFNQITVTIDGTDVGLPISSVTGKINVKNHRLASIKFGTTNITRVENPTIYAVEMPEFTSSNPPLSTIVASTIIVNTDNHTNPFFVLSDLRIGHKTMSGNYFPNGTVRLEPGKRYNLKVKINNTGDKYIPGPIPTVRIGNQIWMAHNLHPIGGYYTNAVPSTESDVPPLHGNYFQWALKGPSQAHNQMVVQNISNVWGDTDAFWTRGPSGKGAKDPCPSGFRVPTKKDYTILFSNTTRSDFGNILDSPTNFNSGAMLTSKDNASVKIFFPSQGHFSEYYNQPLGSAAYQIKERGQSSRYHVSDSNSRNGIPLVSYVDVRTGNTSGAYYYSKPGQGANAGIQISRIKNQMPLKCIKY